MSRYTFVVTPWGYPKVSRTLVLAGRHSLQALHSAIIDAFEFDDDHMHAFFLNGEAWDDEFGYYSKPDFGQKGTRNARVDRLGLVENKGFLYLFDFGDEHRFSVQVSEISSEEEGPLVPALTDSVGDAPEQYESHDDADEDDEEEGALGRENDATPAAPAEWRDMVERIEACVAFELRDDPWVRAEEENSVEDAEVVDEEADGEEADGEEADGEEADGEEADGEEADGEEADDVPGSTAVPLRDQVGVANELLERVGGSEDALEQVADWVVGGDLVDWLIGLPSELEGDGDFSGAFSLAERLAVFSFGELLGPSMAYWAAKLGKRDRALELAESNLRQHPQDSRALLELGLAWKELQDVGRAEQCWREALRFAGSNTELRDVIVKDLVALLEDAGRLIEARKVMQGELERRRRLGNRLSRALGGTVKHGSPKIGRNDPCPCGSGKKYKKCCGAAG